GGSLVTSPLLAQEKPGEHLTQPVIHVAKNDVPQAPIQPNHPLDPALRIAYASLQHLRSNINDYSAILIKREFVNGAVSEYEYMGVKVRNRKVSGNNLVTPFSVYMTFLKPAAMKGREVIYVENANKGKLVAHEGGMKGRFLPTVDLDPTGMLAMRGQRYPITDIGIENLVVKLIEKGERDRKHGECTVDFIQGAKISGRDCTVLSVKHPVQRPYFDFHHAQVFIDNELQIPVRYAAYSWPTAGEKAPLLEEYTYQNIKLNVGLTDADFDRDNPNYSF
ncbi:MAG: DUF1571 domain-containing protein, partial [Planctomycetales bacterium]|nr:DUF1571 domain-containing protein [Planctomycetales bacterium]